MDPKALADIEQACFHLFNPQTSAAAQQHSEALLAHHFPTFSPDNSLTPTDASTTPTTGITLYDSIAHARALLGASRSPYAQLFVSKHLRAMVASHFTMLSVEHSLELRAIVLEYLGSNADRTEAFVRMDLMQLFALVTKLGWLDSEAFQSVLADISPFFTVDTVRRVVGLQMFGAVVAEMNTNSPSMKNHARQRKTATQFRDQELLPIFQLSLTMLQKILDKEFATTRELDEACSNLVRYCLQYDFVGTNIDEASDDYGTIQIPSSWKPTITDTAMLGTLLRAFHTFEPPSSGTIIESLSMIFSVRRTFFHSPTDEKGKAAFLSWCMEATVQILQSTRGELSDHSNHHEFCRLLLRLLNHCGDLADLRPLFDTWVELVTQFTLHTFQNAEGSTYSLSFLLQFWSRLSQRLAQNGVAQGRMQLLSEQVVQSFIAMRLEAVRANDGHDELFDADDGALITSLEHLATLARTVYPSFCETVVGAFEACAAEYRGVMGPKERAVLDGKFTWIVYIIGSGIGARPSHQLGTAGDEHQLLDGQLAVKVLELVDVHQAKQSMDGVDRRTRELELAFLHFFLMFRQSYIGDVQASATKAFTPLEEVFGIKDAEAVLNVFVRKLANNLRNWADDEKMVSHTLRVFHELAIGYTSGKKLRRIETVQYILANHTSETFPFLDRPCNIKSRSLYYSALCSLLFAIDDGHDFAFLGFIEPFTEKLTRIMEMPPSMIAGEELTIIGLFRDLRGIVDACKHTSLYVLFFDWFYPYCAVIFKVLETFDSPAVMLAVLRFVSRLTYNLNKRIKFDFSSPNGILLFREASRVMTKCGQSVLGRQVSNSDRWTAKFKPIMLILQIMTNALSGEYVNFGVFGLYNDLALPDAINICFSLMLDMPLQEVLEFIKLSETLYSFLQYLCREHIFALPNMEAPVFQYIIRALGEGLKPTSNVTGGTRSTFGIYSSACESIDSIATFIAKQQVLRRDEGSHYLTALFAAMPQTLQYLLARVLEVGVFENNVDTFAISKPLLPLILLNKQYFDYLVSKVLNCQLLERQAAISQALQELMEGIEGNLAKKNREKFSTQLHHFRNQLNKASITIYSIPAHIPVPSSRDVYGNYMH
ncbi:armadillo-type protein [Cladochytrium replicatum]|nr:armadillo-type protein [Cladochytrium replicatum]